MSWYTWTSQEAFDEWHTAVKAELGLPKPGINQATGLVDESAQWTTDYTCAVEVAEGDFRAIVEDDVAELVEGLGTPCDPPPQPEIDF